MKSKFDIGKIVRDKWQWIENNSKLTNHHKRMLRAISLCRTEALGGHVDACTDCGCIRISYNSCRNRHCPKCQSIQREKWIMKREEELLPVPYFHVVFTIPDKLNQLCLHHPKMMYDLLFKTSQKTIQTFAKDPKYLGAKAGMTAILHTWGQNLSLHPHLHCIVPGGGLTPCGNWKNAHPNGKFLFPVKAMSKVFRAKFVAALRKQAILNNIAIQPSIFKQLFAKNWVVYAKRPFGGPKQVIEYLGRYTHKIAITNHRIEHLTPSSITFRYKDYRKAGKVGQMILSIKEFIRRFALHILPSGFMRIRHYGFLASRYKKDNLAKARASLKVNPPIAKIPIDWQQISIQRLGFDPQVCTYCGAKAMVRINILPPTRAPPNQIPRLSLLADS